MAKLGQIEALRRIADVEPDTFEMLGETFTVRRKPSVVDTMMSAAIVSDEEMSESEKLSRLNVFADKLLRKTLTEESYTRFMAVCDENELSTDVVWSTLQLLVGAAAGRPTERPSDSSDGPLNTSTSSSSEQADLQHYADQGLRLVPVNDPRVQAYTGIAV
jgi:hypothetical protein